MTIRIQVTGFYEPDPDEIDEASPTGLTSEAFDNRIYDGLGTGIKVADLTDVELEMVDD
jgi:hypothetical protein